MADTLESLEIEIKHSSSGAASEVKALADAIGLLKTNLSGISREMKALSDGIKSINTAFKGDIPLKIENVARAFETFDKATAWLGAGNDDLFKLIGSLSQLSNLKFSEKQFENLAAGIIRLSSGLQSISEESIAKAERLFSSLQKLSGVDLKGLSSALNAVGKKTSTQSGGQQQDYVNLFQIIADAAKKAAATIKSVFSPLIGFFKGIFGKIASIAKAGLKPIQKQFGSLRDRVKQNLAPMSKLISSLGRIAFYRIIRSAIKAVTQALQEGLENAYAFSQGISGEGHRFAEAMDSMSSSSLKMKNQLGSAFISLLSAIAPIVNAIIGLITKIADAVSQLISAITGGTYLKAANVTKKFAEDTSKGAKAAKEWKNQLLGFDEINRLEEPSQNGGGGGSDGIDPSTMFEETPIKESIKQFVDDFKSAIMSGDWKSAGKMLGDKINSIFPSAEQWKSWGTTLGYGLNGAIQTFYYTLKTIDFTAIGVDIANFLNGMLEQIDFTTLGAVIVRKFTAALDFFLGFLGTLDWGLIGTSIGNFFRGALDEASEWLLSKDWNTIGESIWTKFKELLSGIDFDSLATTFFRFLGIAFGAVARFLDGFLKDAVQKIKDYFRKKTEEAGGDAWEGFKKGITDAWANIKEWCKQHVIDPFVNGVKDLLGIHSPSTVFATIGKDIIQGLWNGISEKWNQFVTFFHGLWDRLKEWWNGLKLGAFHIPCPHFEWTYSQAEGLIAKALEFVGLPATIPHLNISWYAQGGFPDTGTLFFANEAGPELVGTMGGRTAVAPQNDIVEGIRQGVYDAVTAANSNGERQVDVRVYLDSREIKIGQNRLSRAMGV